MARQAFLARPDLERARSPAEGRWEPQAQGGRHPGHEGLRDATALGGELPQLREQGLLDRPADGTCGQAQPAAQLAGERQEQSERRARAIDPRRGPRRLRPPPPEVEAEGDQQDGGKRGRGARGERDPARDRAARPPALEGAQDARAQISSSSSRRAAIGSSGPSLAVPRSSGVESLLIAALLAGGRR
jgi:hypothetical protein